MITKQKQMLYFVKYIQFVCFIYIWLSAHSKSDFTFLVNLFFSNGYVFTITLLVSFQGFVVKVFESKLRQPFLNLCVIFSHEFGCVPCQHK